jgi:purine-binding chemotaxis protein CheW
VLPTESGARREAILKERARQLARAESEPARGNARDVLAFELATETYAVEISYVREIVPLTALTPIPCTPAFMLGLINLRGELCPIVDLKRLLGVPQHGLTNATSAVVLHDGAMEFGIVADVIVGVQSIADDQVRPRPATLTGINASFLRGILDDRTVLLDAPAILGHPGIVVNDQVSGP